MVQKVPGSYQVASPNNRSSKELSRLLTAAVISSQFRQQLLNNPAKAITTGYRGEVFQLGRDEKQRLSSIRATSLADFASQCRTSDGSLGIGLVGD